MKTTAPNRFIQRFHSNPILSAKDVPYHATLTFNAGVAKFNGKYVMLFRNDYGSAETQTLEGTNIGFAFSDDGIHWDVQRQPCLQLQDQEIIRAYDPRLTILEGRCYICFAVDTRHGIRGGVAVTDDFTRFQILSLSVPDNLIYWGNSRLLLGAEEVPFANAKIGPAAPPIKTDQGWLTTFHAVDIDRARGKNGWEATWQKRYVAGIMILEDNGEVKIYYGAADAVECLATAHVDDLLRLCLNY